jgi:hypothetical protein
MNLEKELQNQFDLIDSGATMQINRDEDGFIRARVNPMPYLRSPMRQAQPQSLEQTIDEFPTVVGGLAAGATAATLGTIQDIAGLIYGAGKGMAAEEGQKMQTFLDTATEISDKYGSGAVKGFIRDKAEEAGLDEEKLGILDEAMMAGEFGGIGGLAKGAVTAAPKVVSKTADVVQDAGEAAKARMAGGTTLSSGVNPDAAIAAAGDAIAKFRAPTEKEPGIIAFHGSGADFDEFKVEKIGTGTKATQYGHGLYFSDYEDVATYFRGISSPEIADYKLNGNSVTDMYNKAQDSQDYEKAEVLEQVLLHDRPDEIAKRFTVEEGYSQETAEFAKSINYDTLKGFDPDGNEVSLGRTYKTELSVDVENMLDWQTPLKNQPEAIREKVRSLVDEDLRETFDYNVDKGIAGGNAYLNYIGKNKKEASEKLAEAGLDGIKYKDIGGTLGYTLENAPTNYVVFKPEAIKILEKYGIVGPVAITGIAASQQEGESDGQSA